jgi:PmbA protein
MDDLIVDRLDELICAARAAGADGADVRASRSEGMSVKVRNGKLETVQRQESESWSLRLWVGARSASQTSIDLKTRSERHALIERTLFMARSAPEDPFNGLAPPGVFADVGDEDAAELQLFDTTELEAAELEDLARIAEVAALEVAGVTNSTGATASAGASRTCHVTSEGLVLRRRGSSFGVNVSVIAGRGDAMQTDGFGRTSIWRADLPTPESIGREAGLRAVAHLGTRKCRSGRAPVIFERRTAMQLLGPFLTATSGQAIARGASFLKDRLGERVFASGITILDDPAVVRGLGSDLADNEGVGSKYSVLVDDGVLTEWRLDLASARKLELAPNGYGGRGSYNLTLSPGSKSLPSLMADAQNGLLVTGMFGPSINIQSGDWSAGVSGVWFEDGEPVHPVNETTVAGSLLDFYKRIVPGSDLLIHSASNAPSLLVDGVMIAGL